LPVPVVTEVPVLDGRLDDAVWAKAARLEAEALVLPQPAATLDAKVPGGRETKPVVKLLVAGGRLWIGVELPEGPGPGTGLGALLAPEGTASAAGALSLAYAPQDPRTPRFVVRGPRGVGRGAYRLEGAIDLRGGERSSVELSLPLGDLGLETPQVPIRAAFAVRTRTPGILAWVPPRAGFGPPAVWARLEPPEGGWPLATVEVEAERLAREDARDAERLRAWHAFVAANQRSVDGFLRAAGFEGGARRGGATEKETLAAIRDGLLEPLDRVLEHRPDLALVHVVRGDVLRTLGQDDGALVAYDRALEIVPGLREARFARWVATRGPAWATGRAGEPTDYAAARAAVAPPDGKVPTDPYERDGRALGLALLDLSAGDFAAARGPLEALASRYPFDAFLARQAERAGGAVLDWGRERQYRAAEARADTLPRVLLRTARGDVRLELYEDDATNTVYDFVWLVRHGFYDGSPVERATPFLGVLLGGRSGGQAGGRAGEGEAEGPGYAIPTEEPQGPSDRVRRPFRGSLLMVGTGRDTEASRFLILTGTALHLEGNYTVFGRVIEGQRVVESLRPGDVITSAEVGRVRPGVEYRPRTVAGEPAPAPR
ncbi:MAG: peptidylprolyl isomerase, partial [Planctomycetota bacterium]